MITIYHNPRCRKSRAGLEALQHKTSDFRKIEYLKQNLSAQEIGELLDKLGIDAVDLVRKQEDYFKKELKGKTFTREKWLDIFAENPKLIRRPIVVKDAKAVIADPVEELEKIL